MNMCYENVLREYVASRCCDHKLREQAAILYCEAVIIDLTMRCENP